MGAVFEVQHTRTHKAHALKVMHPDVIAKKGADPRADIGKVLGTATDMELLQLTPERASLEDVFRKLTMTAAPVGERV